MWKLETTLIRAAQETISIRPILCSILVTAGGKGGGEGVAFLLGRLYNKCRQIPPEIFLF